ncbi:hypothetical protein WMF18_31785 [Sorangium sp. So ce315]
MVVGSRDLRRTAAGPGSAGAAVSAAAGRGAASSAAHPADTSRQTCVP